MKMIGSVVNWNAVAAMIDEEHATADSICHSADDRSEIGALVFVLFDIVESQHNVARMAIFIRNPKARDYSSIINDLGGKALVIRQRIAFDGLPIIRNAERISLMLAPCAMEERKSEDSTNPKRTQQTKILLRDGESWAAKNRVGIVSQSIRCLIICYSAAGTTFANPISRSCPPTVW